MEEKTIIPEVLNCFILPVEKIPNEANPVFEEIEEIRTQSEFERFEDPFKDRFKSWLTNMIKNEMHEFIKTQINTLHKKIKNKDIKNNKIETYEYEQNETFLFCIEKDKLFIHQYNKPNPPQTKGTVKIHNLEHDRSLINSFLESPYRFSEKYIIDDITIFVKRFTSAFNAINQYSVEDENWYILKCLYEMKPYNVENTEKIFRSNPYTMLNPEQQRIVGQLNNETFSFIQGPPGTGKSQTILAIAKEYAEVFNSMLITAVSNKAVDSVIEKFHNYNLNNPGDKVSFITYGDNLHEKFKEHHYKHIAFNWMKYDNDNNLSNYRCDSFLIDFYEEYNFCYNLSKEPSSGPERRNALSKFFANSKNNKLLMDTKYFRRFRTEDAINHDELKNYADRMFTKNNDEKLFYFRKGGQRSVEPFRGGFYSDNEEIIGGAHSHSQDRKNFHQRFSTYVQKIFFPVPDTSSPNTPIVMFGTIHSYTSFITDVFNKTRHYLNINQIVVDEAGLLTEPDALILLEQFYSVRDEKRSRLIEKMIFVGDPYQLPPFTYNTDVIQNAHENVILPGVFNRAERASKQEHITIHRMYIQYRMHPDICKIVSHISYDKKLTTADVIKNNRIINGNGLEWIDVEAPEEENCETAQERDGGKTIYNTHECEAIVGLIRDKRIDITKLLIITPYAGQVDELKKHFVSARMNINAVTVDKSQGSEEDTVIISAVRCDVNSIGFLKLKNRVMVAISRAKYNLYIVGNAKTLCKVDIWRDLYIACYYSKIINTNIEEETGAVKIARVNSIITKKYIPRSINFEIFRSITNAKQAEAEAKAEAKAEAEEETETKTEAKAEPKAGTETKTEGSRASGASRGLQGLQGSQGLQGQKHDAKRVEIPERPEAKAYRNPEGGDDKLVRRPKPITSQAALATSQSPNPITSQMAAAGPTPQDIDSLVDEYLAEKKMIQYKLAKAINHDSKNVGAILSDIARNEKKYTQIIQGRGFNLDKILSERSESKEVGRVQKSTPMGSALPKMGVPLGEANSIQTKYYQLRDTINDQLKSANGENKKRLLVDLEKITQLSRSEMSALGHKLNV